MPAERNRPKRGNFNRQAQLPFQLRLEDFEIAMQDVYDLFFDVNSGLLEKGLERFDDFLRPAIMSGLLSQTCFARAWRRRCQLMKTRLYTLAIAQTDRPAAEIFSSERAALERRLELSEVSDSARERLLHLFDAPSRHAYAEALNQLESEVSVVCSIEEHQFGSGDH